MIKHWHSCALGILLAFNAPSFALTLDEARALASNATSDELPIVINASVLAELNGILASSNERKFFRAALVEMENYSGTIGAELQEYDVPQAMLAVPLIESGYRNLPQKSDNGAGLWMFIASTAHNYGLVVDDKRDERLDIARETNAGVRLMSALRLRFQSWELALAGYNQGEHAVQSAIDEMHTRDAWALVAGGKLNSYLPRFEAARLIMRNPSLVN